MKIKNITIKNYKFHHNLNFNIKQKNCLIYGENGTGKSSIYKALYSNLYFFKDNKIVTNQVNIKEKFIHRDYSNENLEVNIDLDEIILNRENNTLENSEMLESQTIYLADEKVFHKITQNDFYKVINSELIKHFPQLSTLDSIYRSVKTRVTRSNINDQEEIVKERQEADILFIEKFKELISTDEVNTILNSLNEDFEIEFEIKNSDIEFDNRKFIEPKISIKVKNIDDKGDFKNHFNEAKLKLISIAIYFALAKRYETESELKLLVLDDFLTSLDMANRKLIIQYILENFEEYQKIILTHNIQFYNLIIRLLDMKNEKRLWDIKKIFLTENDTIALVNTQNKNYLDNAKQELISGEYHSSGNYARKEFERIVNEFKQILELGKQEQFKHLIDALKSVSSEKHFFKKPFSMLSTLIERYTSIITILNNEDNPNKKIGQIKYEVTQIKLLIDNEECDLSSLKQLLIKVEFYKDILFNPSSHNNSEIEIYRKECIGSIKLLKELNSIVNSLK